MYISHMRSEADNIESAIGEVITIARDGHLPAEIYHLKLAGTGNWDKLPRVIAQIEAARRAGLRITANMYLYTAGGTGLDAVLPPWVQDGGRDPMVARLRDPAIRARVLRRCALRPARGRICFARPAAAPTCCSSKSAIRR
jgi:N-acyl-D-amino-acid deacylase